MATAEQYAQWIVANADKRGTSEFDTVAKAYQLARSEYAQVETPSAAPAEIERTAAGTLKDIGVVGAKGAVGLSQALIGLADIPTGGRVGKALEGYGFRPEEYQKSLEEEFSPAQKEALKKVRDAEGFLPTALAAIQNPSVIASTLGEALPQMIGGAGVARTLLSGIPKLSAKVAVGLGEGAMGAGSSATQIREESPDRLLAIEQSLAALGAGAGTALFGYGGAKLAGSQLGQRMGLADIDTILAKGGAEAAVAGQAKAGFLKSVIGSGIVEGVFEELPQSAQEQMWQNWATNKPLMENVEKSAALGMMVGSVAGGVAGGFQNVFSGTPPPPESPEAPGVDPTRYEGVIKQLQDSIPEGGVKNVDHFKDIFKTAGFENGDEAFSYLQGAIDKGDIQSHTIPTFEVKDKEGKTLFKSYDEGIANSTVARLNAQEPESASVVAGTDTTFTKPTGYQPGAEISKGSFDTTKFDVVSGTTTLSAEPLSAEAAGDKAHRLNSIRNDQVIETDKQIEALQKNIKHNNLAVESLEAQGAANTPEYVELRQKALVVNAELDTRIAGLNAKKQSFVEPLVVKPAKSSDEGFTVMQNGKPVAHFPTIEEAQASIVGGQAPPTTGNLSQPTEQAVQAKEALRSSLLPFMKQVGLEKTGLKIIDSIESGEGTGDGYYSQNLIAVALGAQNPMGTLRHETIHALKEMGAFTPQEWAVLENAAKKHWVNRFLKQRQAEGGRSLYDSYKAVYQKDKGNLNGFDAYAIEESIAEAFKFFNERGIPPGILGTIFKKIRAFLEALRNSLAGSGFQTADQVFKRVEAGKMVPKTPSVGGAPRYAVKEGPVKVLGMDDLLIVIPEKDRVVSKNPQRMLNGSKFSDANLNETETEGFLPYVFFGQQQADQFINDAWDSAISDVESYQAKKYERATAGIGLKKFIESLGAKPPSAEFMNDSMSLSDSARYWFETSAEAFDQIEAPQKDKALFIDLLAATSQNVEPLPNLRRAISVMSEYLQGIPIETDLISKVPVADAIKNQNIISLKFGNFSGTFKYLNGYIQTPTVSTNDQQIARVFNMEPEVFARNPVLYAVVSKFYNNVRDIQNEWLNAQSKSIGAKAKQPYESWQIQALNWVEKRDVNTSYGEKTADTYDQAIEVVINQLDEADIPLVNGRIGSITFLNPKVPHILSGTLDIYQDSIKATIESNTLLDKSGVEANNEYTKLNGINAPWAKNLRNEFLMIQKRVFKKLSGKGIISEIAKLATGNVGIKSFAMSRMDTDARGTFEGKLSPNMRVPMFYRKGPKTFKLDDGEVELVLAILGSPLDQAAMAASLFKLDSNGDTYRIFLPGRSVSDNEVSDFSTLRSQL